jgi:hypothetical protein
MLIWLLLMAAEMVHGIARTVWLAPVLGDFRARQIAVFSGSLLILLIVSMTIQWMRVPSQRLLAPIGFFWVVLTVGFEIGFGRVILGYPWARLASDYDPREGGLLPIGLAVMALSPWLATRIRGAPPGNEARSATASPADPAAATVAPLSSPATKPPVVYWHRQLPPLEAEMIGEHVLEATSGRVQGSLAHRDELWDRCYVSLIANTEARFAQEVARLGGHYAHVLDESIDSRRDDAAREAWLHGRFTYMLYRRAV